MTSDSKREREPIDPGTRAVLYEMAGAAVFFIVVLLIMVWAN